VNLGEKRVSEARAGARIVTRGLVELFLGAIMEDDPERHLRRARSPMGSFSASFSRSTRFTGGTYFVDRAPPRQKHRPPTGADVVATLERIAIASE
jgi:hypothetical protein